MLKIETPLTADSAALVEFCETAKQMLDGGAAHLEDGSLNRATDLIAEVGFQSGLEVRSHTADVQVAAVIRRNLIANLKPEVASGVRKLFSAGWYTESEAIERNQVRIEGK